MEVVLSKRNAALYGRLHVSLSDISFADFCAGHLLKKGWHRQPWEGRGTTYNQQAAFTTAMITAYGRPFTQSRGWPPFPEELKNFNAEEQVLHNQLLALRHKVFAHSDSSSYSIKPWRSADFATTIVGAPALRVTVAEANLFRKMAGKLTTALKKRMDELLDSAAAPSA